MNHLAVNDCNKKQIVKHRGIPTIVQIVASNAVRSKKQTTYAIETLWKLAFINSHLEILATAFKDANAFQGRCDNSLYTFKKYFGCLENGDWR